MLITDDTKTLKCCVCMLLFKTKMQLANLKKLKVQSSINKNDEI